MSAAKPTTGFRPDIQGLRAVAVVLVVLQHAFGAPAGGYIGVDVFYVISGFLITGLLLREFDASGSISLRGFYARRLRRIVPVAALVLLVTVVGAYLVWFQPRALQVALDAASALLFVSNWHFIAIGTDYLTADGPVSPIQHYWSLSVEEQFYAVWPLLLLALLLLGGRRRALPWLIAAGIALSALYAAWRTTGNPASAYFDTGARAWELLLGALLAVPSLGSVRLSDRWRQALGWIGLAGIAIGVGVAPLLASPMPAVVPGVLGAALVLWARPDAGPRTLLGNRVSQWLGAVSYSLYLWHFPVLLFAAAIFGASPWVAVAAIPVMLLLSALSYRYVERAVLDGAFLRQAGRRRNARRIVWSDLVVGALVLVVIAGLVAVAYKGPRVTQFSGDLLARVGVPVIQASPETADADDESTRAAAVQAALDETAWPAGVAAQLDVLDSSQLAPAMGRGSPLGCRNSAFSASAPELCRLEGDGATVVVLGDSVAMSWMPAVLVVAEMRDWDLTGLGYANCSLIDADVTDAVQTAGFAEACAARRVEMFALVDALQPDLVILAAAASGYTLQTVAAEQAESAWAAGVERTLSRLGDVPRVVIISDPGSTASPGACASRLSSPADCATPLRASHVTKTAIEASVASGFPNADYIDATPWFCTDVCPAFVGGTVSRVDGNHLTEAAAIEVAPLLAARLAAD